MLHADSVAATLVEPAGDLELPSEFAQVSDAPPTARATGVDAQRLLLNIERVRNFSIIRDHPPFGIIVDDDDRVPIIDTRPSPWRLVCALRCYAPGAVRPIYGTGWLVGPRTIVTAGHCVLDRELLGGWAMRIEVAFGRSRGQNPFGATVIGRQGMRTHRAWNEYQQLAAPNLSQTEFAKSHDIAVLQLPAAAARNEEFGWFSLGVLPDSKFHNLPVHLCGYPLSPGNGDTLYYAHKQIVGLADERIYYDVDATPGQSGAPVFAINPDGNTPVVLGIHAYGVAASQSGYNFAPRITPQVLTLIEAWKREATTLP